MPTIDPLILQIIMLVSRTVDVPAPLIAAIIDAESSWNLLAVGDHNDKGEPESFGLMQLHIKGAGHGYSPDLLLNPAFNVHLGAVYLKHCLDTFPRNQKLAISAYNQGPGGAAKRGYGYNKSYVENVLSLRRKYEKEMRDRD